jgi:hypothetical protein
VAGAGRDSKGNVRFYIKNHSIHKRRVASGVVKCSLECQNEQQSSTRKTHEGILDRDGCSSASLGGTGGSGGTVPASGRFTGSGRRRCDRCRTASGGNCCIKGWGGSGDRV